MEISKIVIAFLTILVVVIVFFSFKPLYARVIAPILGLNLTLINDEVSNGVQSFDNMYNFYNSCLASSKDDCTCQDDKKIDLADTQMDIGNGERGIRMLLKIGEDKSSLKILSGARHCYIRNAAAGNSQIEMLPGEIYLSTRDRKLHSSISDRDDASWQEEANPIIIYRIKKEGQIYLCLPLSKTIASQIRKQSCF